MTLNPEEYKLTPEQQLSYDKLQGSFYHFHRQYPSLSYYGNIPAQYSENTVSWIQWMHWIEGWVARVGSDLDNLNQDFNDFVVQYNNFVSELEDKIFSGFKQPDGKNFLEKLENEFNQRIINVKWFGALGKGLTDDTNGIQSAIRFAQENNGIVYVPAGTYILTSELILLENTHIIATEKTTFVRKHDKNFTINFELSDTPKTKYTGNGNITIDGGTWDFSSQSATAGQVFTFIHSHDVMIKNVHVKNVIGGHAVEGNSTNGLTVINSIFEGYSGADFRGAIQLDIDIGGAMGDLYAKFQSLDLTVPKNILIENNKFLSGSAGSWGRAVETHASITDDPITNVKIINNEIRDCLTVGIRAYNWSNVTIDKNLIVNCASGIIINSIMKRPRDTMNSKGEQTNSTVDIEKFIITNNVIETTTADDSGIDYVGGISLWGQYSGKVKKAIISNNIINNAKDSSIFIFKAEDFTVTDNIIDGGNANGISIRGSQNGNISGNLVSNVLSSSIYVTKQAGDDFSLISKNVAITNNVLENAKRHSILIDDDSEQITFSYNQILNGSLDGDEQILMNAGAKKINVIANNISTDVTSTKAISASVTTYDCLFENNILADIKKFTDDVIISNLSVISNYDFTLGTDIKEFSPSTPTKVLCNNNTVKILGNLTGINKKTMPIMTLNLKPKQRQSFLVPYTKATGQLIFAKISVDTTGIVTFVDNADSQYSVGDFMNIDIAYQLNA